MNNDTDSKIAMVAGGTAGVGLSIVRELVEKGFTVHFIGTNRERGAAIESELNGSGESKCRFFALDLSSLKAVRAFAQGFLSEVPHLDVLLHVAGVMLPDRQETDEGLEKTIAIDYLSAFVLSQELVPLLAKASHPRIANVSGGLSMVLKRKLDFTNMDGKRNYSGMRAAIDAVHAKTVMTQILAEKLKSQNIDVNAFHPGAVKSDLGRSMPLPMRVLFRIASLFMATKSTSGNYVSTSKEVTGVTGQIFVKTKAIPLQFEEAYKDQLWKWTVATVDRVLAS